MFGYTTQRELIQRRIEDARTTVKRRSGRPTLYYLAEIYRREKRLAALDPEIATVADVKQCGLGAYDLTLRCGKCGREELTEAVCVHKHTDEYGEVFGYLCVSCFKKLYEGIPSE